MSPRLLDLFSGAGGAAVGYHRAGFTEIVGVDIKPQPHYPFTFVQADATTYPLEGFDAIHASPPCQGESIMRNLPWLRDKDYPMLIIPTRERLKAAGVPYVIENVEHARRSKAKPHGMQAGWLCGTMFGLPFYRHRLFESNFFWMQPGHGKHRNTIRGSSTLGGRARDVVFVGTPPPMPRSQTDGHSPWANGFRKPGAAVGHVYGGVQRVRDAMQIDWMTAEEITQAIPPAYTFYVGTHLLAALRASGQVPA